jgi:hypothetical protein
LIVCGLLEFSSEGDNPESPVLLTADSVTSLYEQQEPGKEQYTGTLGSYISDALGSVFLAIQR